MTRVVALAVWAVGLTAVPAAARADDIWVVPEAPGDRELGRYLARALPGASLREDLAVQEMTELSARSRRSVLRVDLRGGVLEAARPGAVEVLRRRFEPSVGRASPFAIAVAAAELLELPEPPLPPDDPPDDPASDASRSEGTAPGEAVPEDPAEPDRGGRDPREAPEGEGSASPAARIDADANDSDREAETVGDRTEPDRGSASDGALASDGGSSPEGSASEPLGWSFMAGAGYALFLAPSPTTTFHRPYGELAVGFGSRRLRGYFGVVAELFGQSEVGAQSVATATLRRHDVLATLGLLLGVTEAVAIDVRATAGLALPSVDVSSAGAELPGNSREALVFGLGAGARIRLYESLQLAVGAEFGVDEGAQRYLVQGEPVARDGPFSVRIRAGLMWDTR